MNVPLILLAAGRSTRFGTLKQVAPVGPDGASILAYTVVDALVAGFSEIVVVVRPGIEAIIHEHLTEHLGTDLPVRFVQQHAALGTAHAALVGLAGIDGPAAIANGDDAYGRDGLACLWASAADVGRSEEKTVRCSLVGYPIAGTLSDYGGVSRGWIQTDGAVVTAIDEVHGVIASDGSGSLRGRFESGAKCVVPRDALGSMNLWMLGPGIRPMLSQEFDRHQRSETESEFMLSSVLDRLRRSGRVSISVAGQSQGWFGLTFADDLPAARARMAAAHESGHYATPLALQVDSFRL